MTRFEDMTEDEQRAERILRRWIHKATGTSDFEREMQKIGTAFIGIREAVQKIYNSIFNITQEDS